MIKLFEVIATAWDLQADDRSHTTIDSELSHGVILFVAVSALRSASTQPLDAAAHLTNALADQSPRLHLWGPCSIE